MEKKTYKVAGDVYLAAMKMVLAGLSEEGQQPAEGYKSEDGYTVRLECIFSVRYPEHCSLLDEVPYDEEWEKRTEWLNNKMTEGILL
jgi:hypothetical protein